MDAIPQDLLLDVKEMTILELCEVDQKMAMLAFRALDNGENIFSGEAKVRVDRALMSASSVSYGSKSGVTKQGRRDAIGKKLEKVSVGGGGEAGEGGCWNVGRMSY
jgi:hypothetical protein